MTQPGGGPRLPPGQVLTKKWPVLTYGETPRVDLRTWSFRCFGLVEEDVSWSWDDFTALPQAEVESDIHCVTHWSRFDNLWKGVLVREILARVKLRPEAVAVMVHAEQGFWKSATRTRRPEPCNGYARKRRDGCAAADGGCPGFRPDSPRPPSLQNAKPART